MRTNPEPTEASRPLTPAPVSAALFFVHNSLSFPATRAAPLPRIPTQSPSPEKTSHHQAEVHNCNLPRRRLRGAVPRTPPPRPHPPPRHPLPPLHLPQHHLSPARRPPARPPLRPPRVRPRPRPPRHRPHPP